MRCTLVRIMPQVQDRSLDLLTCSPVLYHWATVAQKSHVEQSSHKGNRIRTMDLGCKQSRDRHVIKALYPGCYAIWCTRDRIIFVYCNCVTQWGQECRVTKAQELLSQFHTSLGANSRLKCVSGVGVNARNIKSNFGWQMIDVLGCTVRLYWAGGNLG